MFGNQVILKIIVYLWGMVIVTSCHPSIVQDYNAPPILPKLSEQYIYVDISHLHPSTKMYVNDKLVGYCAQFPQGVIIINRRHKHLLLKRKGYAQAYYTLNTGQFKNKITIPYPLIKLPAKPPLNY